MTTKNDCHMIKFNDIKVGDLVVAERPADEVV